jgi:hypothetical protein
MIPRSYTQKVLLFVGSSLFLIYLNTHQLRRQDLGKIRLQDSTYEPKSKNISSSVPNNISSSVTAVIKEIKLATVLNMSQNLDIKARDTQ